MNFDSDEEKRNGILELDFRELNSDCRDAVNYLCDEWDFCVVPRDKGSFKDNRATKRI